MIEAYPLQWPVEKNRLTIREASRFDTSFAKARNNLLYELRHLGGKNVIISSNIPLKRDGLPYASYKEPDDPGVAVYFDLNGENKCFACDRWHRVVDNLHAIELSIQAIRGIERWGSSDMISALFKGFDALPEHTHEDTVSPITRVDYFAGCTTVDEIKSRRRNLAKDLHPDKGGDPNEFQEMMKQYDKKISLV